MTFSPSTQQERADSKKTVLIIEDDASVGACLVQAIVDETPYLAFLVTDAFQALQVFRDFLPDLLLIDYQLPKMNGFELYDSLRDQVDLNEIPAVMISANLPQHEAEKRHLIVLSKPFEIDDLIETVTKILTD
ncbi:response regulator [Tengunoibacter tsumagoiensis]|uniref:response regulator n=1 Tax=Tengunoibacter tsumagoiensis TaxID=2014871 RepID=UPI001386DCDE|nr:response regulator [Tengunoibacter tsumagoiensis]